MLRFYVRNFRFIVNQFSCENTFVLTVLCQNSAEALLLLRLCLGINKIAKALLHSGLVSTNSYFPYNRSIARNSALSGQSQSPIVTPFLEIGATVRKQQRNVKERSWSPKLSAISRKEGDDASMMHN